MQRTWDLVSSIRSSIFQYSRRDLWSPRISVHFVVLSASSFRWMYSISFRYISQMTLKEHVSIYLDCRQELENEILKISFRITYLREWDSRIVIINQCLCTLRAFCITFIWVDEVIFSFVFTVSCVKDHVKSIVAVIARLHSIIVCNFNFKETASRDVYVLSMIFVDPWEFENMWRNFFCLILFAGRIWNISFKRSWFHFPPVVVCHCPSRGACHNKVVFLVWTIMKSVPCLCRSSFRVIHLLLAGRLCTSQSLTAEFADVGLSEVQVTQDLIDGLSWYDAQIDPVLYSTIVSSRSWTVLTWTVTRTLM